MTPPAKKAVVRVSVGGEDYTLRTDASPEHTRAVAAYVDEAVKSITKAGAAIETHKVAILAALQITDELLRERHAREALAAEMAALADEIRPLLPPQKRD
ncbi:MAG: cell division protein ZapA [Gemmatimonadaceae bacterium]|nr:cell division protein ZapA [Gemmatimonadaceae bacterium]